MMEEEALWGFGMFPSVSKHKMMLPNLMGIGGGSTLMEHSLSSSVTRGGRGYLPCPWRLRACWNCEAVWCIRSILSPLFLSLSSSGTDTLIIVLSETKIGNRSHNNRCVGFHGHDLLSDIGLRNLAGSRSAGIMVLKRDEVRGDVL